MKITHLPKASLLAATLALAISNIAYADSREDIESRIKKVGRLNIASAAAAAAPATASAPAPATSPAAAATTEPTEAPVADTPVAAAAPTGGGIDAEALYTAKCFACHGTGAAGAPILGNAEQWAPRIAQDKETLYSHAIGGFNAMPPKGAAMDLADEQIKAIVDFMVSKSG